MRRGRWWSAALLATWTGLSGAGCAARTASTATAEPAAVAPAASSTSDELAAVFDAAADEAIWSALFVWADTGEAIYARNPDQRLLPASNMKLVTLAAAIQRLGWRYRFETIVFATHGTRRRQPQRIALREGLRRPDTGLAHGVGDTDAARVGQVAARARRGARRG